MLWSVFFAEVFVRSENMGSVDEGGNNVTDNDGNNGITPTAVGLSGSALSDLIPVCF